MDDGSKRCQGSGKYSPLVSAAIKSSCEAIRGEVRFRPDKGQLEVVDDPVHHGIVRQEPVEVMEQHPVKDSPLAMTRTVDSWYSKESLIKKWTYLGRSPVLLGNRGENSD
jgi:hypothetical protein